MAHVVKDSFLDLERHRQLLEANVANLRDSLQHWQTWSAEYEGLKEEILATSTTTYEQLLCACRIYEGDLVTQTEIDDILGVKRSTHRSSGEVVNVIERRIDYVSQNVKALENQLHTAEGKLAKLAVVGRPEVRNEEGLPLMEIVEELDEDGNVIDCKVETHGNSGDLLREAFSKAGIRDLPADDLSKPAHTSTDKLTAGEIIAEERSTGRQSTISGKAPSEEPIKTLQVTGDARDLRRTEEVRDNHKDLRPVLTGEPRIPADESPEHAAIRKEMLEYGMSDINAVVAELDLEDDSDFIDEGYDDEDEDASSLEEEDDFGRSTRSVVDDEMRRRMLELEDKLGVTTMRNAGQNAKVGAAEEVIARDSTTRTLDNHAHVSTSKRPHTNRLNKTVRFAEELSFSSSPETSAPTSTISSENTKASASKSPIGDVIERTAPIQNTLPSSGQPTRVSRCESSRTEACQPQLHRPNVTKPQRERLVPRGPTNITLSSTIQERKVLPVTIAEPDELDPHLLQQEVSAEYYKLRNKLIQRQGGFRGSEAEEERTGRVQLTEEEGGPKRVSRFMAARLARS
ncbi:MAG: hypothetical protein M1818_002937 [Claussenomyces sp. TS43310]|nr:MAG: hypothetical protein M1818_002937 [Claussenomyces sp. TS43310]